MYASAKGGAHLPLYALPPKPRLFEGDSKCPDPHEQDGAWGDSAHQNNTTQYPLQALQRWKTLVYEKYHTHGGELEQPRDDCLDGPEPSVA